MKIAVAPDSFKGCMTALEAARAIEAGILRARPDWEVVTVPMADGGEGTVTAIVDATGGEYVTETVSGPLGRPVDATYGMLGDGKTAVIEMAAASGLPLLKLKELNPLVTSTKGTGELILSALGRGAKKMVVGIGGSATVDGGSGMARVLGVKFLGKDGQELAEGGGALAGLEHVDISALDARLKDVDFDVACDVDNPLTGEHGAAYVYGPQKGATPEMVVELEAALARMAEVIKADLGMDVDPEPGAGAAGGLGAGLMAFLGAKLKPGIDIVVETIGLDERMAGCDLAIAGEGQMDFQTAYGKTPMGVVKAAERHGVPVIAIVGALGKDAIKVNDAGIEAYFGSLERALSEDELKAEGPRALTDCAEQVARMLALGMKMGG